MIRASKRKHWSHILRRFHACEDAVAWALTQPNPYRAWWECKRGDWMIWALTLKLPRDPRSPSRRKLAKCIGYIASRVLPYAGDQRLIVQTALDAVIEWGYGKGTLNGLKSIAYTLGKARDRLIETLENTKIVEELASLRISREAALAACSAINTAISKSRNAALRAARGAVADAAWSVAKATLCGHARWRDALHAEWFEHSRIIRKHYLFPPRLAK